MPMQWLAETEGGWEVVIWVIAGVIWVVAQLVGRRQNVRQAAARKAEGQAAEGVPRQPGQPLREAAPRPVRNEATDLQAFFEKLAGAQAPKETEREAVRNAPLPPPPPPVPRARPIHTAMEQKVLRSSRVTAVRPSIKRGDRQDRSRLGTIHETIKDAAEADAYNYEQPVIDLSKGRSMYAAMRDIHLPRVKIPFVDGAALRMPQPPRRPSAIAGSVHDKGNTRRYIIGRAMLGPPKGLEGFPEVQEYSLR